MNKAVLDDFSYWITEREKIRAAKESGAKRPWTKDPIMESFKFCNVKREDDFVTRWFALNWRHERYWNEPNFIPAIMLGRTINWPQTLERLGFPHTWDKAHFANIMDGLMSTQTTVWTGAYTSAPSPARAEWIMGNADSYFSNPPHLDPTSIKRSWERIVKGLYPGVGPFIAGQVIADLKHTEHLRHAADWWDWAPLGPGSKRGLNRIFDREIDGYIHQKKAVEEMRAVKYALGLDWLCLQDVQNGLCELDKYERVKLGQGRPRTTYNGRAK